ncbi:MAG TPA: PAS domain-containing sensor histidine kinase [Candidatus Saccharimonadales bacterium]|nr:PAS domain-containing sensor histidine kinase [Candidatus Saccharimonadales bacterium]
MDILKKIQKIGSRDNSENLINSIIENIPDVLFVKEVKGLRFIHVNKAAEELFGSRSEDMIGKTDYDFFPKKQADFFIQKDKEVLQTKKSLTIPEEKVHTKTKGERILHTKKIPLFDIHGTVAFILTISADITENIEAQKAIKQEKAKDEFLSIAAHQLRTPLGTMRWHLEELLKRKLTNEFKKPMLEMYESNLRLISLVNDLLDVSRINQNQIQNNPQSTDIVALLKDIVQQVEDEAKINLLSIDFTVAYTPKPVIIDPRLFRQVMQNILSNAIKYNKKRSAIVVTVSKSKGDIVIKTTDFGIGIPAKDTKKIFGKFFRAENATEIGIEGTGLGLFVVKSFVKYWKGKVWLESEEKKGTTVFVTIPIL